MISRLISKRFCIYGTGKSNDDQVFIQFHFPLHFDTIFYSFTVLTIWFSHHCQIEMGCQPILKWHFDVNINVWVLWSHDAVFVERKIRQNTVSCECTLRLKCSYKILKKVCYNNSSRFLKTLKNIIIIMFVYDYCKKTLSKTNYSRTCLERSYLLPGIKKV